MARLNTHLPVRVLTSARYQKTARPSKTTLLLCDYHGNLKYNNETLSDNRSKTSKMQVLLCLTEIVTKVSSNKAIKVSFSSPLHRFISSRCKDAKKPVTRFICSYAGTTNIFFPQRSSLIEHPPFSKSAFYKQGDLF